MLSTTVRGEVERELRSAKEITVVRKLVEWMQTAVMSSVDIAVLQFDLYPGWCIYVAYSLIHS